MIEFDQTFAFAFPPGAVLAAWTDADALRGWLAEHARVEPRVGGEFSFWGRHTPWGLTREESTGRILALDPPGTFEFEWRWRGNPTRVRLDLVADGSGCSVRLRHTLPSPIPGFDAREHGHLLDDLWHLALGNLRQFLRGGRPALRPDFAGTGDVVMAIEIDAPREAVWRALTDPREMDKWLSAAATVEPRPGGRYDFGWTDEKGEPICPRRVIEIEPPRRLLHDWVYRQQKTHATEWTLEALSPKRTRLTVRQIGVGERDERTGYTGGWGKFLLRAKALLEGERVW